MSKLPPRAPPATPASNGPGSSYRQPPDLYQVVIECRDEAQQRELFERLRREGLKLRLLCL